jgi:N-acyl-phosphatidylethanolamine-hydrolysing phospholipase D
VVIISHSHYDHLDCGTIKALGDKPHYFVPLGNKAWFTSMGLSNVTECDWWDEHDVRLPSTSAGGKERLVKIACTPCQHFSGRSLTDRNTTLWASWVVGAPNSHGKMGHYYFAGDTGYCTVPRAYGDKNPYAEEKNGGLEICPVFKEIGEKYGPFELSCIPIGAYSPRWFMSAVHCGPEDAVCVHLDVKSKKSIGMHWGTWILTGKSKR